MNSARKLLPVLRMCRSFAGKPDPCTRGPIEVPSPNFSKLKENQKAFQCDDGVPIYLKAGTRDKVFFQITLVLLAVGMVMSVDTCVKLVLKN